MQFQKTTKEKLFDLGPSNGFTKHVCHPEAPFRMRGYLVWNGKGKVGSITIGNIEQVASSFPIELFESPFPFEHAQAAVEQNMLSECLPQHFKLAMYSTLCQSLYGIQIIHNAMFDRLAVWGDLLS